MAIFQKRGKWWIDFKGADGKRHREPVGASHALAKEVLAKRRAEAAERKHFPGRVANARPFSEVADKFWDLHGQHLRSRSWSWIFGRVKAAFGAKKVGTITAGDVQAFYNGIAGDTSPANANRYLCLIRLIFNKAKLWGDSHGDNPCSGVRKGRESVHRTRYLSPDEIDRLLKAAHPRLYPVLACALLTGMRRGEILGLTWENVDLDRDTIHLERTKSGKSRDIPVCSKLHEVLTGLFLRPSGSVFDLPVIMLRRFFDRAVRAAGIHGFRFHDLRHSFASHFIMRTNDLPTLQALLGHSTPAMTQRYAHLSRGHLASEMAAFESAIPVSGPAMAPRMAPPIIDERSLNAEFV